MKKSKKLFIFGVYFGAVGVWATYLLWSVNKELVITVGALYFLIASINYLGMSDLLRGTE